MACHRRSAGHLRPFPAAALEHSCVLEGSEELFQGSIYSDSTLMGRRFILATLGSGARLGQWFN
eukprot:5017783-Amphidinium_carterae.2